MNNLSPKEIIKKLDDYIIGQHKAKRAVAIALRNRWRRKQIIDKELQDEILPHNIIMVGPTGVGKTEIARRVAKLSKSPFIKIEATKFTEIGYVGKDVDSIIRDLLDIAVKDIRKYIYEKVRPQALLNAKNKIVDQIVGKEANILTKQKYYEKLEKGELNNSKVKIHINEKPQNQGLHNIDIPSMSGAQMGIFNVTDILQKTLGEKKKTLKTMNIKSAIQQLTEQELVNLANEEEIINTAKKLVEDQGIVFLDEIDKIAGGAIQKRNEINREGVQRDLLPLIEGTVVNTKYGAIKTKHILFIAAGAFHMSQPSDLLPELQGRLPIKVKMNELNEKDLYKILTEKKNSLPKQYTALLKIENIELQFEQQGLQEIARHAIIINNYTENIGARRLYTILDQILDEINFYDKQEKKETIIINKEFVLKRISTYQSEIQTQPIL